VHLRILFAEFQSRVRSQAGLVKAVKAVKVLEYKAPAAFFGSLSILCEIKLSQKRVALLPGFESLFAASYSTSKPKVTPLLRASLHGNCFGLKHYLRRQPLPLRD
jgi:hypothetical protein